MRFYRLLLQSPTRISICIIAVKEVIKDQLVFIPTAKFVLKDSDILIMLGRNESLDKLKVNAT